MGFSPNFTEIIARRKLGVGDEWRCAKWTRVGRTPDLVVTLGIPRILTRGPHKGSPSYSGSPFKECVVTDQEDRAERAAFERNSGKCVLCGGDGQQFTQWSRAHGNKFSPCQRCNATGAAPGRVACEAA